MRLPNGDRADLGTKLEDYTLNNLHRGTVFEAEFAGKDGRAYAILPTHASKLMILRDTPA